MEEERDEHKRTKRFRITSYNVCYTKLLRASMAEIFRALFPCASITGAPKAKTMEIISAIESTPRHIYTGAFGWLKPGRQAHFNVAIRTVLVDRQLNRVV